MIVGVNATLMLKMPCLPAGTWQMAGSYGRCKACHTSAHLVMQFCAPCCRKSYESEAN